MTESQNTPDETAPVAQFAAATEHTVVPAGTEAPPAPQPATPDSPDVTVQTTTPDVATETAPETTPQPVPETLPDVVQPSPVETGVQDVSDLVTDIHRMMTDVHRLVSDLEPAVRKVIGDVEQNGLPGLLSLFMRGGK